MKVAVRVVLDVDVEKWRAEYGSDDESATDIRESVRYTVRGAVGDAFRHITDIVELEPEF